MPDDRYRLRILTRCRVAGLGLKVGATLLVPPDKLRVAAHLVKTGAARPLDERTARDVELHQLLAEALRRPAADAQVSPAL